MVWVKNNYINEKYRGMTKLSWTTIVSVEGAVLLEF